MSVIEPTPLAPSKVEDNVGALQQLNRAEVDSAVATAKAYPRDPQDCMNNALRLATLSPEIASEMSYALKRGNKTIEGPSIRLAEVVGSTWGNLNMGSRIVEIGEEFVTAQGVCHDLETNVRITKEVKRRITDKHDKRFNADMIQVTCNAAASIALRDCLFRVIPKVVVEQIRESARQVAVGDAVDLPTRVAKAIDWFKSYGVDAARVLEKLGLERVEQMGPDQLAELLGYATAIKDGESSIENVFTQGSKTERVAAQGSGSRGPASGHRDVTRPAKPAPPAPPVTPATPPDTDGLPDFIYAVQEEINRIDNEEELANLHAELANDGSIDPSHLAIINTWVRDKRSTW